MTTGGTFRDPTRLTDRSRQSAIEGHSALCDYKRAPRDNPLIERLVNLHAVVSQNALSYADACISQLLNALAGMPRIYVDRTDNHVPDTSLEYCICAGSSASLCRAWFQRDVKRGMNRHRRGQITEAFNLSVIAARPSMMSSGHDSIADDQDRSNRRIRAGLTERLLCLVERGAHKLFVSFSIHCFETSIVVLICRGNGSRHS